MKVCLCVCTCDRAHALQRLLNSLADIDLGEFDPRALELLVVDNHPTGGARLICETSAPLLPFALRFVEEPRRGISFARNRAVDEALDAEANFVAFIDDDDLPEPNWLWELIVCQQRNDTDVVFGRSSFTFEPDTPSWMRANSRFEISDYAKRNAYGLPAWASTGNVLIGATLLGDMRKAGPVFASEFALIGGEDKDFFIRAIRQFAATYSTTDLAVVHRPLDPKRSRVPALLRSSFRLGCSSLLMSRKHRPSSAVRLLQRKVLKKLLVSLAFFPAAVRSKATLIDMLCKISKAVGVLYASFGGRYDYYGRKN